MRNEREKGKRRRQEKRRKRREERDNPGVAARFCRRPVFATGREPCGTEWPGVSGGHNSRAPGPWPPATS
eukprot:8894055-Alexandrium_andersonii.AAC.1